jgi:threonine dehydrogenase-like Zn-dependent dehydrogenase
VFHPYCHASPVVVGQDRFGDLAAPGKGQAMGVQEDEITVLGSMAVLNSFAAAADLMAAGVVDTGPMLGSPFALDQFPEALASVRSGEGIKIQVAPGG